MGMLDADIPATNSQATRQGILDATLRCLIKYSIEKTSISSIAKEAGLTRATVYSYFPTKEEVLHAALLQVVVAFCLKLVRHIESLAEPRERLLEALVFICIEIPKDPHLKFITDPSMASQVYDRTLTSKEGQAIRLELLRTILNNDPAYADSIELMCEIQTRMIVSILVMRQDKKKTRKQLQAFFQALIPVR
jgi:AcrR family transcriptional regulator